METQVRFTIITPTIGEKRALELKRCLSSSRVQDFPNYRHIVIADGHDAISEQIVRDRGGIYLSVEKGPLGSFGGPARNKALEAIEQKYPTDYILYCDDDNYFFPEVLKSFDLIATQHQNPPLLWCKTWHFSPFNHTWYILPNEPMPPREAAWDSMNGIYRSDCVSGLRWQPTYIADFIYMRDFMSRYPYDPSIFVETGIFGAVHS